ncbi:hypothetical protein [Haloarcula sp. CGMCC 1.6347]|uniref:hypothetical protein n=1 Tax=Haloarcula sp. CGMCC 1.6347 TaxID=3111455 RepID=UPI00300EB95A
MTVEYLYIEFVYPTGQAQVILDKLREALNEWDAIELGHLVIKPQKFGAVGIEKYNDILEHWPLEESEIAHETTRRSVDFDDFPTIQFTVKDLQYLKGGADHPLDVGSDEPLRELLDILKFCYTTTEERPIAVYSTTPDTPLDLRKPPITAESVANSRFTYLPWLTILPPAMVEEYGRETVLSTPAWHVDELDDGSVLLVCHNDIVDWDKDCRTVAQHIGLPSYRELG